MAKTQLTGKRIAPQSILLEHFDKNIKIPEEYLQLKYDTHMHENLSALNVFYNSNPNLAKSVDIKDIYLALIEVFEARDKGVTLKKTVQDRALKSDLDAVVQEIEGFKNGSDTLEDAYKALIVKINSTMEKHEGITSHKELDIIYNEVVNARGVYNSLSERLENISSNGGTGGGGSSAGNSQAWNAKIIVPAGERVITAPNSYSVGTNSLFVFEGPILLSPGVLNDYIEVDSNTIRLNEALDEDTEFTFMGVDNGSLYDWCIRIKSTDGQEVIPTMYKYKVGLDQLVIYEDGILLSPGVDYIEKDEYSVQMNIPLPEGCSITIAKRR